MPKLPTGVRKRKDGSYEWRFYYNGKSYSVYAGRLKDLQAKKEGRMAELEQGITINKKRITLDKYYGIWQTERRGTVKRSTMYTQDRQFKHIKAALGEMKLKDIEAAHVVMFREELIEKNDEDGNQLLSTAGINLIMSLLNSILRSAKRRGYIMNNPCENIQRLKPKHDEVKATDTIHRALTFEETETFFQFAKSSWYRPFFEFLLNTGMRTGEAAALLWSDIDYEAEVIHITKTVTRVSDKEVEIGTPKTRGSIRDIPLTEDVKMILEYQRYQTSLLHPKRIHINGRIFAMTDGESLIRTTSISTIIKYLAKKASIAPFGAHAFRDTYATRAIECGMDPLTLQRILGHDSYEMTNKYTQATSETMKSQAAKVVTRRGKTAKTG